MSVKLKLTQKQEEALNYTLSGKNVFITGPGGVGKSVLVKEIKKCMEQAKKSVVVTSTTGISALLIGGFTLHSYLGIGLGTGSVEEMARKIRRNKKLLSRWEYLDCLIIDEISMLSPELFDKLEKLARVIRSGNALQSLMNSAREPVFGGIQLVLCGDFLQLPVVNNTNFSFQAEKWNECIDKVFYLSEIIRQSDTVFQNLLNEIRMGRLGEEGMRLILSRMNVELKNEFGIRPTRIYTTNASVEDINNKELEKLARKNNDLQFYEYEMEVAWYTASNQDLLDNSKKNCIATETLQLCEGAQVMLLCNLDFEQGLVNGSRGVVVSFADDMPVVRFLNGLQLPISFNVWDIEEFNSKTQSTVKLLGLKQIPLKVAYAITVHKSQGCTLDSAEIDLRNVFEYGQAYVALSRVKSLENLLVIGIDFDKIKAHPLAIEYYEALEKKMDHVSVPIKRTIEVLEPLPIPIKIKKVNKKIVSLSIVAMDGEQSSG